MPKKKERAKVPTDIEADILFRNDHRCCMCGKGPKDGKRIQIHHINEDPSDNRLTNLAVLCRDCHDPLKDRLWMGRGFLETEVRKYKALWERAVRQKRKHLSFPAATVREGITEKIDEKGEVIERHIEKELIYLNGLAPQALAVTPPVALSDNNKLTLKKIKKITSSKTTSKSLLSLLDNMKQKPKIRRQDRILLSRLCLSIGDKRFNAYDYKTAEIFYTEALSYARSAKEPRILQICLYELGASVGMQRRHKEALNYFSRLLIMDTTNHLALFNKSVALYFLGKHSQAFATLVQVIKFGKKASDWSTVASAQYNMGYAQQKLNKYQQAVGSYRKAIEFGKKASDWSKVSSAQYNMGNAQQKLNKYQQAVGSYRKAIEFGKKASDWSTVASAHSNMGNALDELNKYQQAVGSYRKAIEFGKKASDWSTVASAQYNMGNAQQKLNKYQQAVGSYRKAIELRQFLPDKGHRIFSSITLSICVYAIINIKSKKFNRSDVLSKILASVYSIARKERKARLILNTLREFKSKLPRKEQASFKQFETLFQKYKKL